MTNSEQSEEILSLRHTPHPPILLLPAPPTARGPHSGEVEVPSDRGGTESLHSYLAWVDRGHCAQHRLYTVYTDCTLELVTQAIEILSAFRLYTHTAGQNRF